MKVANEILNQLGGNRFRVMTGATNFVGSENSLSMKLRRNQSKANYLTITLNSMDTYDMEFVKFSMKTGRKVVKEVCGVYNDMLQSIFTDVTGYDTHL